MKIGLLALSGKPIHSGHWALITKAASENDNVIVYVSISDRKRDKEFPVLGADMLHVWTTYLQPLLPNNVTLEFGGSPIRKIYQFIDQNQNNKDKTFVIYSDENDLKANFPIMAMEKYFENIWQEDRIKLSPISRLHTVDISGTQMREFLANKDEASFCKYMPPGCDSKAIYKLLLSRAPVEESLLRQYITKTLTVHKKRTVK